MQMCVYFVVQIRDGEGASGKVLFRKDGSRHGYTVDVRALNHMSSFSVSRGLGGVAAP